MAVTLIRRIQERPSSIVSDGTYCYIGNGNKILRVTISSGAKTVLAIVGNGQITALCSDGTYLYAGDSRGQLTRVTIADGTLSVLEDNLQSAIIGISHNTTTRYLALANGKLVSRA